MSAFFPPCCKIPLTAKTPAGWRITAKAKARRLNALSKKSAKTLRMSQVEICGKTPEPLPPALNRVFLLSSFCLLHLCSNSTEVRAPRTVLELLHAWYNQEPWNFYTFPISSMGSDMWTRLRGFTVSNQLQKVRVHGECTLQNKIKHKGISAAEHWGEYDITPTKKSCMFTKQSLYPSSSNQRSERLNKLQLFDGDRMVQTTRQTQALHTAHQPALPISSWVHPSMASEGRNYIEKNRIQKIIWYPNLHICWHLSTGKKKLKISKRLACWPSMLWEKASSLKGTAATLSCG